MNHISLFHIFTFSSVSELLPMPDRCRDKHPQLSPSALRVKCYSICTSMVIGKSGEESEQPKLSFVKV